MRSLILCILWFALERVENYKSPFMDGSVIFLSNLGFFFFSVEVVVTCDEAHLLETSILGRDESLLVVPLFLLTMDEA